MTRPSIYYLHRPIAKPEPFEASELPVGAAVVEWLAEYLPAVALGLVVGMMMTVGLAFVWAAVLSCR